MALGAQRGDVLKLVVGQGLGLTFTGVGVGLAGALVASRILAGLLYDTQPLDTTTFVTVASLLVVAGILAPYIPARRATRVDPVVSLQQE